MTIEQLRRAARNKPFVPFSLYLSDGRELFIAHPEMIVSTQIGRTVVVFEGSRSHTLDLLHITDIEREISSVPLR